MLPVDCTAEHLEIMGWGNTWSVVCLLHLLSNSGICSEVKLCVCWHTALRKEYELLLVLPDIHLPCSHTCQEVLSVLGCAHVVDRSIGEWAATPRDRPTPFPLGALGIGSKTPVMHSELLHWNYGAAPWHWNPKLDRTKILVSHCQNRTRGFHRLASCSYCHRLFVCMGSKYWIIYQNLHVADWTVSVWTGPW